MTSMKDRKAALEARLSDLNTRLGVIERELDSHQDKDWEEMATEREGDEVLEGMGLSAQAEVRAIRAALARIASGEYGFCVKCGAKIAEERLDLLPYAPLCQDCAV
jgi:RNA polymerase-binding transcription factor DksA